MAEETSIVVKAEDRYSDAVKSIPIIGIFLLHFNRFCGIKDGSSKALNRKIACLRFSREGWPPVESRPGACRLVRLGAAAGKDADGWPSVIGARVCTSSVQMRVVPRKVSLSSPELGRKGFLFSFRDRGEEVE